MKLRLFSIFIFVMGLSFTGLALADDNSQTTKELRREAIKTGKIGKTIDYGPKNPKSSIWVFTDLNCPACQELHHEVKKLSELGIQVRFMAFPRRGLNSPGYTKLVSVWCAKDSAAALEQAMQGANVPKLTCDNPVKMQYLLGHRWGILGTPTIIYADGTQQSGSYPADRIAREAEKHSNSGA